MIASSSIGMLEGYCWLNCSSVISRGSFTSSTLAGLTESAAWFSSWLKLPIVWRNDGVVGAQLALRRVAQHAVGDAVVGDEGHQSLDLALLGLRLEVARWPRAGR